MWNGHVPMLHMAASEGHVSYGNIAIPQRRCALAIQSQPARGRRQKNRAECGLRNHGVLEAAGADLRHC